MAKEQDSIKNIAQMLRSAERMGSSNDVPEGSRYMQISDTLANQLANTIERAATVNRTTTRDIHERIGMVRSIDTQTRTVEGYASTGEVDRYGEIVAPKAFEYDLKRFLDERHLFAASHMYVNYMGEPTIIGSITSGAIDDKGLQITAQFDTDPLSEKWWQKYTNRDANGNPKTPTMNAFSVGFIPKAHETRRTQIDGKERDVLVYTQVELLEISATPIPANRESIVMNSLVSDPEQAAELLKRFEDLKQENASLRDYVKAGFGQILGQLGVLAASAQRGLAHHGRTESDQGIASLTNHFANMRKG